MLSGAHERDPADANIGRWRHLPDLEQWRQDREDPRWDQVLAANNAEADSLGLTGTPSLLVTDPNGQQELKGFGLGEIESAIEVRGTINDWSDQDKGWTVEGRIPWRDFLPTGGRPAPGGLAEQRR